MPFLLSLFLLITTISWAFPLGAEEQSVDSQLPPNPVRLVLPSSIPAVVGQECNVYFDNITLVVNPENWAFDAICSKGIQQQERWTWIPAESDVGEHPFQIEIRDEANRSVATAKSVIRVVPANRLEGKPLSVLCVGDSLTHASVYTRRLLNLAEGVGNPQLTLVGSHWIGDPNPNRHEGYGGWTAHRFATHFATTARSGPYAQRGSPFLYPDPNGNPGLDFIRYCQDVNAGKLPDVVTIFLGPNDIFSFNDNSIEAGIDDMLRHYDLIIRMITDQSPSSRVAVLLPVPPAATQDAFGANYGAGQTRWQYKRNQHRLVERMLKQYSGREAERIHVVPTCLNLDCHKNYPADSGPTPRLNNGVHPSEAGYFQIGDTLFAWLKGLESLSPPPDLN